MLKLCVIVLAAGEGKRMKSATPKVLHDVAWRPMLSFVMDAAASMKPKKTVVVLSPKRPEIRGILDKSVAVAFQKNPLGTADAVAAAVKDIPKDSNDVMVLYGDTPLIRPQTVRGLYEAHVARGASCTVLTTFLSDPRGYGRILRNDAGRFLAIVEEKDATAPQKAVREINTGLYCFNKEDLLAGLKHVRPDNKSGEYYLTDVLGWLFGSNKKVETVLAEDPQEVLGVNSRRDLREAAEVIRMRILESFEEQGVVIEDPKSTFIDPDVTIGSGTRIRPFTYIEKDVAIGRDCSVGPFCHLRPGAVLCDRVAVGNFAEVKNSTLGEESVMHHVGYLGDTETGRRVNIGAGTVVANFDGQKKNKTIIKDQAFIGSDAVLIAPVVIGKKAVVGAGSVVTRRHDVADRAVVAGVPARALKPKHK
ncbi:MAG: NTP transferase domain-containing protein [Candidatus Omnitrophica bacterium]|nr:NTP transferase domain-containing protein [Candidatus Omnitrophota bacterium]MDD5138073.1 NTP transferase domain-containing protein [Candidatus Omnitrophota bacterium]MDD5538202.1 NTP transferase domain-containing protein [Candidatus Omnitrophota bacterium]